jgi:hypothetical protein
MGNNTFIQERAYIYAYTPQKREENEEVVAASEEEETNDGVIVIDILGD